MSVSASNDGGFQSEINVTPLVDVVLVLLIIFMVIVPLTMRGYDVDIPGESTTVSRENLRREQFVLGIDLDGCPVLEPPEEVGLPGDCRVRLNDDEIPVTELAARVSEIFGALAPQERVLFLAADDELNYEAVMRVVDLAQSGVEGLRIGMVS
jgi:biopolymer transport protein ExbD